MNRFAVVVKAALASVLSLVALGAAPGCAGERDPINRVQANAVPKSIFLRPDAQGRFLEDSDSWYFRATITDVPTSQATAFIGAAGEMSRMKWRISGDGKELQGYREDPDILNSGDAHGGTIVAFPILSHFDVRRAYNSSTGEETNVIEENTTDRTWDKREYMRVDWGTNKISEAMFVAPGFEAISGSTTYVEAKDNPDHPVFEKEYVDITARYTVMPDIETCFYYYRDTGCGPGDISARLSFMKVPNRDYEPREYPDRLELLDDDGDPIRTVSGSPLGLPVMDEFGFFRTERARYDQRFGSLEKRYLYRANVWNLWQEWYARDPQGRFVEENGQKRALKYKERKVRPIVYFLNADWPNEMSAVAQATADMWNDAFAETVAGLRLLEDSDVGSGLPYRQLRDEVKAMADRGERVFVLCPNNPVKEGDHAACGKVGTVARQGDLRYSFMYWVAKPQPSGPLGFGPSYADPVTGELFSANAYVYGAALDTYAQTAVDIVNLINGKTKDFEYVNGVSTDEYAKRLARGEVPGPKGSAVPGFTAQVAGTPGFSLGAAQANVDLGINRPLLKTIAAKGLPVATGPSGAERRALIRGTPLERKILDTPETHFLAGKSPEEALTDADLKKIGDTFATTDIVKKENDRQRFLGEHGCYLDASLVDDSVVGLARQMAAKYASAGSPAEQEAAQHGMWNDLRARILSGLIQHEVGHTVGLRHNFEGSSDALNFFDEFWDMKKETLSFGAPLTDAQKNGSMTEFQYSSVMDYGSRFNSDIHGLGKYDYAAIRFGYGNLLETFPKDAVKDPLYNASPTLFGTSGFFAGYSAEILDDVNRHYRHYTQIPGEFSGGVASIKKSGREIRLFGDVAERARQSFLKSKANTSTVKTTAKFGGYDVVPYRYCGDEFAGTANRPLCQRWDQGMDPMEVVSDAIRRYKEYYVFDAFTRGRTSGFNLANGYLGKIATRYFSHVHQQYIHWLFYQGSYDYYWRAIFNGEQGVKDGFISNADWFKDPGGGLGATMATTWGLDRLIDVLGSPDVGVYVPNQDSALVPDNTFFEQVAGSPYACRDAAGAIIKCGSSPTQVTLDIDSGARYRYTRYDNTSGQGFFNRIKNIGSFYDKIAALLMLTNTATNFIGQDQTNAVTYRIGFYLAYPKAMSTIFGGVTTDAFDKYAWRVQNGGPGSSGAPSLLSPDVFQTLGSQDGVTNNPALRGTPLDSGWFFYYKAYALLFSMAEFQSNFSQAWNDAVRVWCVGCGEAFTPGAGVTPVTMSDPLSGKQYAAVEYADGRYSPGADLVRQGQKLITDLETRQSAPADAPDRQFYIERAKARVQNHIEFLDLVRGLYQTFGYTRF